MYSIRRVKIGKTRELDELAHECGLLYSQTLVFFWRTVRHKGIWLEPKHLMRLFTSKKLHQWSAGTVRQMLTYKAERCGMTVALQEERYTSKTCPRCGHRRKSKPVGRVFHCTNRKCGFTWHRDGVGAINIRAKYRGDFGSHVVGAMAPPTSIRYVAGVARRERVYRREAVGTHAPAECHSEVIW